MLAMILVFVMIELQTRIYPPTIVSIIFCGMHKRKTTTQSPSNSSTVALSKQRADTKYEIHFV